MKKLYIVCLLFCTIGIIHTSCMSEEQKLNALIEEAAKKTMYYPDSYDPIELECDTLRITIINDVFMDKADSVFILRWKLKRLDTDIYNYKWEIENSTWQSKKFYDDRRKWMADAIIERNNVEERLLTALRTIQNEYWGNLGGFYGFWVKLRFRGKANNGNVAFVKEFFILDKSKSEVLATYSYDKMRFQQLITIIDIMNELGEDIYKHPEDEKNKIQTLNCVFQHIK